MILVVGGAGYIGSHTAKLLVQKGYETVVYDNLITGHRDFVKRTKFVEGDLADKQAIAGLFKKYRIDTVIHFAAFTDVGESVANPAKFYRNNLANTLNLLEVMKDFNLKKFIFSSSCAAYGIPNEIPITENHRLKPINPYGKGKLMAEQILHDFDKSYRLKYVSLRYFNAAGADPDQEVGEWHEPETHLIPLALKAASGQLTELKIFGTDYDTADGTCVRDYIHVTDLADAHIRAMQFLEANNDSEIVNLGNGTGYSVREVINAVKKVTGKNFKVVEQERRPGDPPILIGSNEKARKVLSWKPQFSDINQIVKSAWDWHVKLSLRQNSDRHLPLTPPREKEGTYEA